MNRKKVAKLIAVVVLVGAVGAGGSLALLTAQSHQVTNTFVVGKGLVDQDLVLDEAHMKNAEDEDQDGEWTVNRTETPTGEFEYEADSSQPRVEKNKYVNLQADDDIYKDPTVHVLADTADCYLFINVKGVDALSGKGITIDAINNNLGKTWKKVNGDKSNKVDGIYYLAKGEADFEHQVVKNNPNAVQNFMIFESLNADNNMFDSYGNSVITEADTIQIKTCAVQATGVTPQEAENQLPNRFTNWE